MKNLIVHELLPVAVARAGFPSEFFMTKSRVVQLDDDDEDESIKKRS